MATAATHRLVSAAWLRKALPRVHVFDTTWALPGTVDARATFVKERIPGAMFLHIDEIDDSDLPFPHMMPSKARFASIVHHKLGVLSADDPVIVYDSTPVACASHRAYLMFRHHGHRAVSVLDGGLEAWKAAGGQLDTTPPSTEALNVLRGGSAAPDAPAYAASLQSTAAPEFPVVSAAEVAEVSAAASTSSDLPPDFPVLLDARSEGRCTGEDDEPWRPVFPTIKRGRVPGSLNLPFNSLLHPETGLVRAPAELAAAFAAAGVPVGSPRTVICTCGSGVTAATLALALKLAGHDAVALFDGSWCEWGNDMESRVQTGPIERPPYLRA